MCVRSKRRRGLLLAALLFFSPWLFAQTANRKALVIANGVYRNLPPIPAAGQEAQLIVEQLRATGFQPTLVENKPLAELQAAINQFVSTVQAGDVCFVYYTGHASQLKNDDELGNFLITPDYDTQGKGRFLMDRIPQALNAKAAGIKMFAVEGPRRIGSITAGLSTASLDVPETMYAFAAATDSTTVDAPDAPGIFTQALAAALRKPGITPVMLFDEVASSVAEKSQRRQRMLVAQNLTTRFLFREPVKEPAAGALLTNHTDRQPYVFIPAGTFLMGCAKGDDQCKDNEKPQHQVTISKGFWIAQNEVTREAYLERFFPAARKTKQVKKPQDPGFARKYYANNHPIVGVDWEEAEAFCSWAGGRLPTEAEWEMVARDGQENQIYPPGMTLENARDKANFSGSEGNDIYDATAPVRQFDPLPKFHVFDMAGNVWEWVHDFSGPYPSGPVKDPTGPESGKKHVARGGSFASDPTKHLRISIRGEGSRSNNEGFRCVLEDTPAVRKQWESP